MLIIVGGGAGITIHYDQVGTATIYKNSDNFISTSVPSVAANFYATSYDYNGETIISYRGTDDALDVAHGWLLGDGYEAAQGQMAIDFYNGDMT
ncbi:MAG: hypothetical protein ACRBDL_11785 [Alphaproteobacteria bacterium]